MKGSLTQIKKGISLRKEKYAFGSSENIFEGRLEREIQEERWCELSQDA